MTTSGQAGALIAGRYRLERPTGGGTWPEEIWQGFDETLNRPVMLRLLPLEGEVEPDLDQQVQSVVAQVARLGHPNIAQVYDVGHEAGLRYVVSEWTGGRTLGQIMATGRQRWQRTVDWGQQIAEALGALHAVGLVDGVLGPDTVSVLDDRRVKLTDVGLGAPQDTRGPFSTGADEATRLIAPGDDEATRMLPGGGVPGDDEATRLMPGGADDDRTRMVPPYGAAAGDDESTRVVPPYGDAEATRVVPGGGRGAVPGAAASDVYALGAILWTAMVGTPPEVGPADTSGPDLSPLRDTGAPADLASLLQSMLAASAPLRPSATVAAHRFAALVMEARESRSDTLPTTGLGGPGTTQGLGERTRVAGAAAGAAGAGVPRGREPERETNRGKVAAIATAVVLLLVVVGVALALALSHKNDNGNSPSDNASFTVPTGGNGVVSVSAGATTGNQQSSPTVSATTPSASATSASPTPSASSSASASSSPTPSATTPTSSSPTPSATTPSASTSSPTSGAVAPTLPAPNN